MRTVGRTFVPLLLSAATALGAMGHGPSAPAPTAEAGAAAPEAGRARLPEDRWGVAAVSLRPTMDGRALDFRYRVLDAAKAAALFDRKIRPYLYERSSAAALGVPEGGNLGALRASLRNPPVAGKVYYVLFANPLGKVASGSRVTVALGDCRFDEVLVE